jgi:hypothetical protein
LQIFDKMGDEGIICDDVHSCEKNEFLVRWPNGDRFLLDWDVCGWEEKRLVNLVGVRKNRAEVNRLFKLSVLRQRKVSFTQFD